MNILVVGSRGQDGTLLSDLLRQEGHEVSGLHLGGVDTNRGVRPQPIDLHDPASIENYISAERFDEIYYLAAFQGSSEEAVTYDPGHYRESAQIHEAAFHAFLESIRRHRPSTRVFYACSSHVFADSNEVPQTEHSAFAPNSLYGITKLGGHLLARMYRKKYGLFSSSGILYNHESPLRPATYLSQKIVRGALRIKRDGVGVVEVGNLENVVDWGHASDFVRAMRLCLSLKEPDEFIIATGEGRTVRQFIETAFAELQLDWTKHVRVYESLAGGKRSPLVGNPSRICNAGWVRRFDFTTMIRDLIEHAQNDIKIK